MLGLSATIALVWAGLGWARVTAPKRASPSICRAWRVVSSPVVADGTLSRASATSSTDVWAVGTLGGAQPIIEHWDGTRWTEVTQPGIHGPLAGVAAVSSDDAWAVGHLVSGSSDLPLIEHWDGSSWSPVRSPAPGHGDVLNVAAAVASSDVWAAGYYTVPSGSTIQPLYLHWDGSRWQHIPEAPGLTNGGVIGALAVASATDVWAGGVSSTIASTVPLFEHWDGTAWSVVTAAPPPGGESSVINGIAAVSSDDVWAVAWGAEATYIEHWDGTAWTIVNSPAVTGILEGIASSGTDDIWAVGEYGSSLPLALTEHWDGISWTQVQTPSPGSQSILTYAIAINGTDVWAVGDYILPSSGQSTPLTMHSNGPCQ